MKVFQFVSATAAYDIPATSVPHDDIVDGLRIREEWTAHSDTTLPDGVKAYRIYVEADVDSLDVVRDTWSRAHDFIDDLDRAWPYIAGEPLQPIMLTFGFGDGPIGWSTNFRELERYFAGLAGSPLGSVEVLNRHWMKLPIAPLRGALAALTRFRLLTGPALALHELHFSSLKSTDSNAQLFLLAKCLEVVRYLLPGRDDAQRQRSLHPVVQGSLTYSLHDLIGLANTRVDIRHAVRSPRGPTMHSAMSAVERARFIIDANAVVRGVLCDRLEVQPIVIRPYEELSAK
jgi:hypothetical protein